jgi:hypothetical protein
MIFLWGLFVWLSAGSVLAETIIFQDDFNRPNSQIVGNGWQENELMAGDSVEIFEQAVRIIKHGSWDAPGWEAYPGCWHYFTASSDPNISIFAKVMFAPYLDYGSYFEVINGEVRLGDPTTIDILVGVVKQGNSTHLRLNYMEDDQTPGTFVDVPYQTGQWYHITFFGFNFINHTYRIRIDDAVYGPFPMIWGQHNSVCGVLFQVNEFAQGLSLKVDDVRVQTSSTIPTFTEWGLIIFGVVLLGFITWVFLKRRKAVVSVQ